MLPRPIALPLAPLALAACALAACALTACALTACARDASDEDGRPATARGDGVPMGAIGAVGADIGAPSASPPSEVAIPRRPRRQRASPPDPFADPPDSPRDGSHDGGAGQSAERRGGMTL